MRNKIKRVHFFHSFSSQARKKEFALFFILFVGVLFYSYLVSAINIEIEKKSSDEVYIKDLNKPIVSTLTIKNLGKSDYFEFYNLVGFLISPSEKIYIENGGEKEITLEVTPLSKIPESGFYTFPYYIKGSDKSEEGIELTFKIIDLKDAFAVVSNDIEPKSSSAEISIINKENVNFENVSAKISSHFFNLEKTFNLSPKETKRFNISLNKNDFKELTAGFYTMTADINIYDKKARVEGVIRFAEKNIVTTTKNEFGLLVSTQIIEKINEGNLVEVSETIVRKNIISRLFTSFSPEPNLVERNGAKMYYTWVTKVNPGETHRIAVKTNWLFPFLIVSFIVIIVFLAKQYSKENLVLKKRVSFVRAKGSEFALKISILVSARKHVERINVVDRLPPLVELYERFGGETPTRVDRKNRRIEWNFDSLHPGETRVISYMIYSKIGVLGKFALPEATAIYEKEGDIKETESNVAFFVSEQRKSAD